MCCIYRIFFYIFIIKTQSGEEGFKAGLTLLFPFKPFLFTPKGEKRVSLLGLTDLHLNEAGLFWECAWQNPRVTEAGSQQHRHDEHEEDHCKHRYGGRQVDSQVRASAGREHLNQSQTHIFTVVVWKGYCSSMLATDMNIHTWKIAY